MIKRHQKKCQNSYQMRLDYSIISNKYVDKRKTEGLNPLFPLLPYIVRLRLLLWRKALYHLICWAVRLSVCDRTFFDFLIWEYVLVNRHIKHRNKLDKQLNTWILLLVYILQWCDFQLNDVKSLRARDLISAIKWWKFIFARLRLFVQTDIINTIWLKRSKIFLKKQKT